MTRVILVLLMLLPVAAIAQEQDPNLQKEQPGTARSVQKGTSRTRDDERVSFEASLNTAIRFALGQGSNAPPPQKRKQTQPSKPSVEIKRPRTKGTMVGYIDNGIVGSQVRIRFEAAFRNEFPDRAEFFYAKCECYKDLKDRNPAMDKNAPGPDALATDLDFQQLYLDMEYAPTQRFSLFVEAPVRWVKFHQQLLDEPFPNRAGLGDIMAGLKLAMFASPDHYLTIQLRTYLQTGDAFEGLGTNHTSLEPALLYYRRLSQRLVLESQVGARHTFGGSAGVPTTNNEGFSGDVFFYGIGPSYELFGTESVRFAPVVELVGWTVLGGFQTLTDFSGPFTGQAKEVGGTSIINLKVGGRTTFGTHSSFYLGYGRALTSADWYRDVVRVEYRYSF